ncbi:MAG TPA: hypothetical protein VD811_15515 [Desulfuromonadales bacterium]|nr:hypothetical protein [Desulfuromonadales bacterium]
MFFIPLSQVESVELVIHALRMAGGQADCSSCPAVRVCMKQCLTIAEAIQRMIQAGTLPVFGEEPGPEPQPAGPAPDKARLQVVK